VQSITRTTSSTHIVNKLIHRVYNNQRFYFRIANNELYIYYNTKCIYISSITHEVNLKFFKLKQYKILDLIVLYRDIIYRYAHGQFIHFKIH